MKVFQNTETLPVFLMINFRSREQKWCRVRASCRRRTGTVVPGTENLDNLTIADRKGLSEGCESRNNHRHAVVVQDLATQWIRSYPCKTTTSQETQKSLRKFLEPTKKPKVIYTDNSWDFRKACEDLSWNHCTCTPHRSGTNGIAERAERRVKEGTSAVLLQSGLDEKMVGGFHWMLLLPAKCSTSLVWWEDTQKRWFGIPIKARLYRLEQW